VNGKSVVDIKSKFIGCMLGSAIGDAIGEIAFSYSRRSDLLAYVAETSKLRYTDDTAMAIGLAESITTIRGLDQEHLGATFSKNFQKEPWRGYASGPPTIFSMVKSLGITYVEAAHRLFGSRGSYGNGAAMRIAPLGLLYYDSPDLYEKASASAEVTHAHALGMDGASVQACAVAMAVKENPQNDFPLQTYIQQLWDFARTTQIREKLEIVKEYIQRKTDPSIVAARIGRSVAVHESMPFAIYCFLLHPKSFEECLFCAVLNRGDRDTLGAMACAISGAYLGAAAIPAECKAKLENRAYIEELAGALADLNERSYA